MGLSRDPDTAAICAAYGKARLTKGEAKSQAKRQRSRSGGRITAYRCRYCGGWHIGNRRTSSGA